MNSFTTEMMLEIVAALDECDADDAVRAVIFTGAGERAYCAGADLGGGGATFDYDKRRDTAVLLPEGDPASPVAQDGTTDWSHRPEERRAGKGVVSTFSSWWLPDPKQKMKLKIRENTITI